MKIFYNIMSFFGIIIFKTGMFLCKVGFKVREFGRKIGNKYISLSTLKQRKEFAHSCVTHSKYNKSPYFTNGTRKCSGLFKRIEEKKDAVYEKDLMNSVDGHK